MNKQDYTHNRISRKDVRWLENYRIFEGTTDEDRQRIKCLYVDCILSIEQWMWAQEHHNIVQAAHVNRAEFLADMISVSADDVLQLGNSPTLAFDLLGSTMEENEHASIDNL